MTTQTKEQQAVALAKAAGFLFHDAGYAPILHTLPQEYSEACFVRLISAVREANTAELVANAVVMPEIHEDQNYEKPVKFCDPDEVREAIAAMQAKNDELKALADSEGSRAVEYQRRARAAEARVAELGRLVFDDAFAISFQTMGQYRSALIAAMKKGGGNVNR